MDKATSWSNWCDRLINPLKWPAALLSAAVTPLLAWGLLRLLIRVIRSPWNLVPFAIGGALFVVVWRRWLRFSRIGRFLITFEHESTHALFALATGHRILSFHASMGTGGQVRFQGGGNWLIVVAPYFFPTAALMLFALAYLMPFQGLLPWSRLLLGTALAYHIVSTYRETHKDQTDIQQLGMTFCWLFLPAANLAVVGLLISFAHAGSEGLSQWLADMNVPLQLFWQWTQALAMSGFHPSK